MTRVFDISAGLAIGDAVALTGAVRDLKSTFPNAEIRAYRPYLDLWANNPNVKIVSGKCPAAGIKPSFPFYHHIVHEHRRYLEGRFDVQINRGPDVGQIFGPFAFRPAEGPYIVLMAGGKYDMLTKWWPWWGKLAEILTERGQTCVHLGDNKIHWHPTIPNTINWVGKTTFRQFFSALYHASGLVSPITAAVHAIRAVGNLAPMVTIGGGTESPHLVAYENQHYISRIGQLDCCPKPCWQSRCNHMAIANGESKRFADCMRSITPEEVADTLLRALC